MRLFRIAAVAALFLFTAGCGTTQDAATATDDAMALAEKASAQAPRSGSAKSEKSQVEPSTAVATSMGATAIAAPTRAVKDGQSTSTGHTMTGFIMGGATDSQMAYVNGLLEKDVALQSIGAQIESLLSAWNAEGGQTPERAAMLTDLRAEYEVRFDKLAKLGSAAMPASVDLSKLTTLGVFNWASGYAVGGEQKPMSTAEAAAAKAAAIAQWQAIRAIVTGDEEAPVDGGDPLPVDDDEPPAPPAPADGTDG